MPTYRFPEINVDIVNPTVIKDGHAGGIFKNNISVGGFYIDLKLITTDCTVGVRIEDVDSQPDNFSVEAIDAWINDQLSNYEV